MRQCPSGNSRTGTRARTAGDMNDNVIPHRPWPAPQTPGPPASALAQRPALSSNSASARRSRVADYGSRVPDQHVPAGCSHRTRVHPAEGNQSRSDTHVDQSRHASHLRPRQPHRERDLAMRSRASLLGPKTSGGAKLRINDTGVGMRRRWKADVNRRSARPMAPHCLLAEARRSGRSGATTPRWLRIAVRRRLQH